MRIVSNIMKSKPIVIILVLACLGLGTGWLVRHQSAVRDREESSATISRLSNEWTHATTELDLERQTNQFLQSTLQTGLEKLFNYSNDVTSLTVNLAKVEAESKAAAKAAQAEVAKRDAKIAELENQREDLTKKMTDLNSSITGLEGKISDTEKKLASSEGDRAFLLGELKRLQAEKAELERQFNDLAVLREQVRKLRDELSIAKRIDWIRRGILGTDMKGGERMMAALRPSPPPPAPTTYSLDVELRQDGAASVRSGMTNSPSSASGTNRPAK